MKRVLTLIILIFSLAGFFWFKKPIPQSPNIPPPTATSEEEEQDKKQILDFEHQGTSFRAAWIKTTDFENLALYPNFKEKLSAREIMEQKKCRSLVSAGFYTEKGEPIGLFLSEGEKTKGLVKSLLFDGFFSIEQDGKVQVSFREPAGDIRVALQSGPVLIKEGRPLELKITDDESARRVVLALSKAEEIVFFIIFTPDSVLEGPLLADLSEVVQNMGGKVGFEFEEAINLDGGSASAFYTDFLSLPEFSSIGSYFCLKS